MPCTAHPINLANAPNAWLIYICRPLKEAMSAVKRRQWTGYYIGTMFGEPYRQTAEIQWDTATKLTSDYWLMTSFFNLRRFPVGKVGVSSTPNCNGNGAHLACCHNNCKYDWKTLNSFNTLWAINAQYSIPHEMIARNKQSWSHDCIVLTGILYNVHRQLSCSLTL